VPDDKIRHDTAATRIKLVLQQVSFQLTLESAQLLIKELCS